MRPSSLRAKRYFLTLSSQKRMSQNPKSRMDVNLGSLKDLLTCIYSLVPLHWPISHSNRWLHSKFEFEFMFFQNLDLTTTQDLPRVPLLCSKQWQNVYPPVLKLRNAEFLPQTTWPKLFKWQPEVLKLLLFITFEQ